MVATAVPPAPERSQAPTGGSKRAPIARDLDRKVPRATTPRPDGTPPSEAHTEPRPTPKITAPPAPPLGGMRLAR